MKPILLILVLFLIAGCGENKPSQADYDKLQGELKACQSENTALKDTPAIRLLNAQNLESSGSLTQAEEAYKELVSKFSKSNEAEVARQFVAKAEKERKEKVEEEEKRKQLGFKMLKEQNKVEQGDTKITFSNIKMAKRWVFDNYGSKYYWALSF